MYDVEREVSHMQRLWNEISNYNEEEMAMRKCLRIADFSFTFPWLPPGWKQDQLSHLTHRPGWRICEVLLWSAFTPHAWSEEGANRGAAAEVEALGEQQPNLGNSWVWTHETSAHQRHYCTKLLVHQSRELHQTQADVVKETRPLTCLLCSSIISYRLRFVLYIWMHIFESLYTVTEPPSTGLFMQANEGAVAEASKMSKGACTNIITWELTSTKDLWSTLLLEI